MTRGDIGTAAEIRNLSVVLGGQRILDGLDMDIYRGEILGVIGSSGSGKSILLQSIVGILPRASGRVRIFDQEGKEARQDGPVPVWSVLFQDGALFSALTVAENIEFPVREYTNLSSDLIRELVALKIDMVGLPVEVGDLYPWELSGGMRKRAALARALALDPEILFLDEPTSGLDPMLAEDFDALISRLKSSLQLSVFLVTHDPHTLYSVCDRIAVLGEGRILAAGTLEEVSMLKNPFVHRYFNSVRASHARRSFSREDGFDRKEVSGDEGALHGT